MDFIDGFAGRLEQHRLIIQLVATYGKSGCVKGEWNIGLDQIYQLTELLGGVSLNDGIRVPATCFQTGLSAKLGYKGFSIC